MGDEKGPCTSTDDCNYVGAVRRVLRRIISISTGTLYTPQEGGTVYTHQLQGQHPPNSPIQDPQTMPLTVHHLQVSQSERIPWLCEELQIPYTLTLHQRTPIFSPHPSRTSARSAKRPSSKTATASHSPNPPPASNTSLTCTAVAILRYRPHTKTTRTTSTGSILPMAASSHIS